MCSGESCVLQVCTGESSVLQVCTGESHVLQVCICESCVLQVCTGESGVCYRCVQVRVVCVTGVSAEKTVTVSGHAPKRADGADDVDSECDEQPRAADNDAAQSSSDTGRPASASSQPGKPNGLAGELLQQAGSVSEPVSLRKHLLDAVAEDTGGVFDALLGLQCCHRTELNRTGSDVKLIHACHTPFTPYSRLSNQLYNRFDNRLDV